MSRNDRLTVNAIRVLSAEAIQKAKSGHPGMPLGAAPMGYALWAKNMKHNPADPNWADRDRFVLSAGHGSMLLYSLLHLFGYGLTIEDIKLFRQYGSLTPGHPEHGLTAGVETSTGPLGQGFANAVGMAMAEKHLAARFNREGYPVVDHRTFAIMGDGCMMEGVSHEAASIAGTLGLNKLVALYDDNDISIEGNTDIAFRDDVAARFTAYGWNVIDVADANEWENVDEALKACASSDKPTLIICHTHIGYGSPKQDMASSHGEPLGEENLQALKDNLGWTEEPFVMPEDAYAEPKAAAQRGAKAQAEWTEMFENWSKAYPELRAEWDQWFSDVLPHDFLNDEEFWSFSGKMATRAASGECLNHIVKYMPNLFGGSADLGPSNKSLMKGLGDFTAATPEGANLHFGVREMAMAAICNGVHLHGGLRPYCATFFVFSDYMKNAMRMSALMELNVPYILTHDSIGVGEDGPTHQPIEQLVGLRSMPGMIVFRPADANETAAGWYTAITGKQPVSLVLTRQDMPLYENSGKAALKGAYILSDSEKQTPDVILIGTGSEVEPCMGAQKLLREQGIDARVVSMPCMELFERQTAEYKESVLPSAVRRRVCVEAGSPESFYRYAGIDGKLVCMNSFGASAPYKFLFPHFGFSAENVAAVAKEYFS